MPKNTEIALQPRQRRADGPGAGVQRLQRHLDGTLHYGGHQRARHPPQRGARGGALRLRLQMCGAAQGGGARPGCRLCPPRRQSGPRARPTRCVHPPSSPAARAPDREGISSKSFSIAALTAGLMAIGGLVMAFGPTRALAARWLPKPGEGPSRCAAARFCLLHVNCAACSRGARVRARTSSPTPTRRDLMEGGYWKHAAVGLTEEAAGVEPQARATQDARTLQHPTLPCTVQGGAALLYVATHPLRPRHRPAGCGRKVPGPQARRRLLGHRAHAARVGAVPRARRRQARAGALGLALGLQA